jgi:endonuclease/exonuclease/phosphatase family metal-dependent hydrolase
MKRPFRLVLTILLVLIGMCALYLTTVIGYAMATDYRPAPQEAVDCEGRAELEVVPDSFSLLSWNIGYAGLGAQSDFFYDGGKRVRMPKPVVQDYLTGILDQVERYRSEADFFLLQEVDRASRRSHYIDEVDSLSRSLPGYTSAFAINYQVGFIPIPLLRPMGQVKGGLATWSRYRPLESVRHDFEGNYRWPTYLFFLDRCFLLQRFELNGSGRQLVLINTHNSAYDDGSLKQRQMAQLKAVILQEYQAGHYVIVGGDWNQYPPEFGGVAGFPVDRSPANAHRFVPADYPAPGWQWTYDPAIPSNRSLKAPFAPDTTRRSIIDYFLVSPNVEVRSVVGIDLGFAFSDHQPVRLTVRLP